MLKTTDQGNRIWITCSAITFWDWKLTHIRGIGLQVSEKALLTHETWPLKSFPLIESMSILRYETWVVNFSVDVGDWNLVYYYGFEHNLRRKKDFSVIPENPFLCMEPACGIEPQTCWLRIKKWGFFVGSKHGIGADHTPHWYRSVCDSRNIWVIRAAAPYVLLLLLITYVSSLSLLLPNLLYDKKSVSYTYRLPRDVSAMCVKLIPAVSGGTASVMVPERPMCPVL